MKAVVVSPQGEFVRSASLTDLCPYYLYENQL